MNTLNNIGLDKVKTTALAQKLNDLLANYSVFYQNVRGYHWNIQGDNFFELHAKFEELYNDLFMKIDEVAERILTLGEEPAYNFSKYLEVSDIKETHQVSDGKVAITEIIDAFAVLLAKQRTILAESGDADDEGTNSLMSDYITEQEKLVWMYSAYLK